MVGEIFNREKFPEKIGEVSQKSLFEKIWLPIPSTGEFLRRKDGLQVQPHALHLEPDVDNVLHRDEEVLPLVDQGAENNIHSA